MGTGYLAAIAATIFVFPVAAGAAEVGAAGALARTLLQGCLAGPNKAAMVKLASTTPSSASLTSQADLGKSVFVLEGGMN